MTREEIKNKVIEIIADKLGFSQSQIEESTSFKYDLGTDSLDNVELLMEFERIFSIKIPDGETLTVHTVGKVIDGICEKLGVSICKQQQHEVDLDEEILDYINKHYHIRYDETLEVGNDPLTTKDFEDIAHHFYELGLNARKEK